MVEDSIRVVRQIPNVPVHEKKGCVKGQIAITKNIVYRSVLYSIITIDIYLSSTYLTFPAIGFKFSFTYPAEGGNGALLFPRSETEKK